MGYPAAMDIKTENGKYIFSGEIWSNTSPRSLDCKMFDIISDLVQQGLASHIREPENYYRFVVKVEKATDLVKKILIPLVETIQDNEGVAKKEQRNAEALERLKSFPSDESLIIEAWGAMF